MVQITIIAFIALYFLIMVGVGLHASRKSDHEGYVIGNRNVGIIPTTGSLAASLRDGSGIVFWVGIGFTSGYGGLSVFLGFTLGYLALAFVAPKARKMAAEKGYVTIGEMIKSEVGPIAEKLSSLIVLTVCLFGIAMQLYVSGHLVSEILDMPPWSGIFSVAGVVMLYLFFGGYSSVIKTDALQFFLILSLLCIVFFIPISKERVFDYGSFLSWGARDCAAFFFFGFIYAFAQPDAWQRVFSARDDKVIRVSFPLAGIFLFFMTISLLFVGMSAGPILGDIGDKEVFFAIFEQQIFPAPILAFLAVVCMAITMSTLDTYSYVFASTLTRNFLLEKFSKTREDYIRFTRLILVVILITMSIVALTISDIVQYLFNVITMLSLLGPVFLFAAMQIIKPSKAMDIKVSITIILSWLLYFYLFITGRLDDLLYLSIPAIFCLVLLFISLKIEKHGQSKIKRDT